MILYAHDPGARQGWAAFRAGALAWAGTSWPRAFVPGATVVVEIPESRGGRTRATTDDLIKLALRAGEASGFARAALCIVVQVKPSEWKGSVPKAIHHKRILAQLDDAERAIVAGATKDVLDAVGLGIWYLTSHGIRRKV